MSEIAIKVENVSKQYRLGSIGTGTLSHDLNKWWYSVRGKENPYLKIGEANDRTKKGGSEYVWSLRDINFEVKKGAAVGIIGSNGAGKSTLLKLLSRVTAPTTGSIKARGRIASLLEVGTGFHPDLTGRENIFLNGAILGMKKNEIKKKFDEIVDFAGVEKYIETPVKRYSSGMYVRLAFAVAAYLESEILIVDEVLAVGDSDFQKKCLGKMGEVSKGEGRTVLFVSHNMAAIQNLCESAILLLNGSILANGDTNDIIDLHLAKSFDSGEGGLSTFNYNGVEAFNFISAESLDLTGERKQLFRADEDIVLRIKYQIREVLRNLTIVANVGSRENFSLWSQSDGDIFNELFDQRAPGIWQSDWLIPKNSLRPGKFIVSLGAAIGKQYLHHPNPFSFEISADGFWKKSALIFGSGGSPIALKMEVTKPVLIDEIPQS